MKETDHLFLKTLFVSHEFYEINEVSAIAKIIQQF